MKTYALPRIPEQFELQHALNRLSRKAKKCLVTSVLGSLNIDLVSALGDDPRELTTEQRRVVARTMQDFGAAFMVGTVSAAT